MYAWGLPSFKKIVTDYYVKTEVLSYNLLVVKSVLKFICYLLKYRRFKFYLF